MKKGQPDEECDTLVPLVTGVVVTVETDDTEGVGDGEGTEARVGTMEGTRVGPAATAGGRWSEFAATVCNVRQFIVAMGVFRLVAGEDVRGRLRVAAGLASLIEWVRLLCVEVRG